MWHREAWTARAARRVHWIGPEIPADEETRLIWRAIAEQRLTTFGEIARYVAAGGYRQDLAAGGWLADIGFLRAFYLRDACRAIERLRGRFVEIDPDAELVPRRP